MGGSFLPLVGWAVAAASVAHVSAALALTGGSLAAGELSAAQAVFALLLGNGLGIVTRALRQNAGYYFGLFPAGLARSMLFWNVGTMALRVIADVDETDITGVKEGASQNRLLLHRYKA